MSEKIIKAKYMSDYVSRTKEEKGIKSVREWDGGNSASMIKMTSYKGF